MEIRIFRDLNGNTLIQRWQKDEWSPAGGNWIPLDENAAMFVAFHLATHKGVSCVLAP